MSGVFMPRQLEQRRFLYRWPTPLRDVKRSWATVCQNAGLGAVVRTAGADGEPVEVWKADARLHDLRQTFASLLVSDGSSLPVETWKHSTSVSKLSSSRIGPSNGC